MAKRDDPQTAKSSAFQLPGFDALLRGPESALDPFRLSGNALLESAQALNKEILGFAQERLAAGMSLGQSLAQCRSLEDALRLQADFAQREAQSYLAMAERFMSLALSASAPPSRGRGDRGSKP